VGTPYVYVFKTVRTGTLKSGDASFTPVQVDDDVGVGRQIAVGHLNTDGKMDICVANKLGLYLFFAL